ncbi:MAG: FAD synthetase family protein [Treponema sp.]|nr:FAD synthetase family protein [Treponema sp.]
MKILTWEDAGNSGAPAALSIGVFDGVHRGHQLLIQRVVSRTDAGLVPWAVTFRQHPRTVLKGNHQGDIYSLRQKLDILESLGIFGALLIDFSGNFSKLGGRAFVEGLKKRLNPVFLAVGSNFRCGYRLDTDAAALRNMTAGEGIKTEILPPVREGRHPVSSSRIRAAIGAGDLAQAALLLGRRLRIDLRGLVPLKEGAVSVYDLGAVRRILPPDGVYQVLVFGQGGAGEGEVKIDGGRIIVPYRREEAVTEIEFGT